VLVLQVTVRECRCVGATGNRESAGVLMVQVTVRECRCVGATGNRERVQACWCYR